MPPFGAASVAPTAAALPSLCAKQASAGLSELSCPLLQGLRRFSIDGDVGELIGSDRRGGSLGDATAIDRNFALGDPNFALELAGVLTVEATELGIRQSQIPCEQGNLHIAFQPHADFKKIGKCYSHESPR